MKTNTNTFTLQILPSNTIDQIPDIVLEWYKQGIPDREIRKQVELAKPKYKEYDVDEIINKALLKFKKEFCRERDHILALHLSRYDETINKLYLFKSKYRGKRAIYDTNDIYQQLLVVMRQKETLFGFHKKSFQIRVSNVISKRKQAILSDKFNIGLLSPEEQLDFLKLLTKAKANAEDDIKAISLKESSEYTEYQEIDWVKISGDQVLTIEEKKQQGSIDIASVTEKLKATQLKLIADTYSR